MTSDQFTKWLRVQRALGYTVEQVAASLHKDRATIFRWKQGGTSKHTDLAIAAVDAGLKPQGDE